jgi:hypothetical protein
VLTKGMTIMIPKEDRVDATGPTELLLTETPESLDHRKLEWVRVKGVELEGGFVTDGEVALLVRVALLRKLAAEVAAVKAAR